ncbi:MAG: serine hydrolase [Flavobacteriaceae bacterium]
MLRLIQTTTISFILLMCYPEFSLEEANYNALTPPVVNTEIVCNTIQSSFQDSIYPLESFYNPQLEAKLQDIVDQHGSWGQLVEAKKMCIGVVDLNDMDKPRFASLNGDVMLYAASLPKIAVLLAAEVALEKGEIKPSKSLENDMRLMISKSNNQATTRIIDLLGYDKIEAAVTAERHKFYDPDKGGGLWVGKRYASGGPTNREPIKNLSHAATVDQVCRFYYLLINRQLVSADRSEHMLKMLEAPKINHKFVYALKQIDPDAKLYRKSGTWKNWHADSILVWGNTRKYILVALIQDPSGEKIIRNLGLQLDRAIIK